MHTTRILKTCLPTRALRSVLILASQLRDAYRDGLRARQARATARTLDMLDDRMLLDLGLDRSELLSAAAELHGQVERERRRAVLGPSHVDGGADPRLESLGGALRWRVAASLSVCVLAILIAASAEPEPEQQPQPTPTAASLKYESPYPAPRVDPSAPPQEPAPTF